MRLTASTKSLISSLVVTFTSCSKSPMATASIATDAVFRPRDTMNEIHTAPAMATSTATRPVISMMLRLSE